MRSTTRGSVLISVMVILMIASVGVVLLTFTLHDYGRMEAKMRDELRAFFAAEAGCLEVISWFNMQGSVIVDVGSGGSSSGEIEEPNAEPGDPSFSHVLFQKNDDDLYQNMATHLENYPPGTGMIVPSVYWPVIGAPGGKAKGRITSLEILNPTDADRARFPYILCVVVSEGQAPEGSTKRATLYVTYHRLKLDGAPGVLLSRNVASFGGNVAAHWGEIWAHGNMRLPLYSQMKDAGSYGYTRADDPWLAFRSENNILFDPTWSVPTWFPAVTYVKRGNNDVVTGTNQPADGVITNNIGVDFGDMFWQDQTLDWPNYDYFDTKEIAIRKGRYYGTDAAGNVYRDGIKDAEHLVEDLRELNTGTLADRNAWGDLDYDVVFIDTIDGNPPMADGSNMVSLDIQGHGYSWKGFYYICASLDLTGMGKPSSISCDDPSLTYHNLNIFMDGILVVRGLVNKGDKDPTAIEAQGNNIVYGSLFAEQGYLGTGDLEVFYNWRLANGFPFAINNMVELEMWKFDN